MNDGISTRLRVLLSSVSATLRLARRLHSEWPRDGWYDAWRTARLIRQIAQQPLEPLTDQQRFELEVMFDLDCLPVTEPV